MKSSQGISTINTEWQRRKIIGKLMKPPFQSHHMPGSTCWRFPLHQAAKERRWHIVELLLEFGADDQQKDWRGRTLTSFLGNQPQKIQDKILGEQGNRRSVPFVSFLLWNKPGFWATWKFLPSNCYWEVAVKTVSVCVFFFFHFTLVL